MKKLTFLLLLSLLTTACQGGTTLPEENKEATLPDSPVIHISIVSHNEEPSLKQPDYLADEDLFWDYRDALVEWATMLHEEGVIYNWQSDWNFLMAIDEYDTGTESTNGKNVAVWMQEDLGFEIDPHAHESKYNYADVAYLMEKIGVEPSGIVGGYLAAPVENSKVEYLQNPIEGWVYDTVWTPEAIWGGGTGNHINEEGLWASGIWRPASSTDYFTDDASAIPSIGNYSRDWDGLRDLIAMQENGELVAGEIYTISIMSDQRSFFEDPTYIEDFRTELESFQSYADEGIIEWAGLSEVLNIWETLYDSEPNILHYDESAAVRIFTEEPTDSEKPFKKNF